VVEGVQLLRRLQTVRRRARALAALEGGAAGLAAGGALAAGLAAVARARAQALPWRGLVGLAAAAALAGVARGAARRLSLARCARLVDATLDRGGVGRDRVLSALSFVESGADAPLARGAIADALTRAEGLRPALVAPARPPRALPALAAALGALALVAAWPAAAPGARRAAPATSASLAPFAVATGALRFERDAARDVRAAATRARDAELATLATELAKTLDALAAGTLDRGAALERLDALATRARDAADEGAAERDALAAAAAALERAEATRAAGKALAGREPDATERELQALAATGGDHHDVASAFASAAAGVGKAGGERTGAQAQGEAQRRLRRDREAGAGTGAGAARPAERRLERLRRDLDDTASACRASPEACRRQLGDRASSLAEAQRRAAGAEARRRLESAVSQLRERLRRGGLDGKRSTDGERAFSRAARGEGAPAGDEPRGAVLEEEAGATAGDEGGGGPSSPDEGAGDGAEAAGEAGDEGAAAAGSGVGQGEGTPLGGKTRAGDARGHDREARVKNGAGPTRAEVIESAARRGFATSDYVRVFGDYAPAAEEAIATADVPEGRRYVVRRYFQLIRPRAHAAPRKAPAP
jgi:hypothetical protein